MGGGIGYEWNLNSHELMKIIALYSLKPLFNIVVDRFKKF